ncbi:MAG: hypothetical protein ACI3YC_07390 [Alloprevotella sp.]
MKRYIKPASELIDLEMGVMIAASNTPGLDGSNGSKEDPGTARSPIWRNMDSSDDSRLF